MISIWSTSADVQTDNVQHTFVSRAFICVIIFIHLRLFWSFTDIINLRKPREAREEKKKVWSKLISLLTSTLLYSYMKTGDLILSESGEKKVLPDRISKFLKITFFCEAEIIRFNISSCFKHSLKPSCGRNEYYNNRKTFFFYLKKWKKTK